MTYFIGNYSDWALTLDNNWGGISFITPDQSKDNSSSCEATWSALITYVYQGPSNDT